MRVVEVSHDVSRIDEKAFMLLEQKNHAITTIFFLSVGLLVGLTGAGLFIVQPSLFGTIGNAFIAGTGGTIFLGSAARIMYLATKRYDVQKEFDGFYDLKDPESSKVCKIAHGNSIDFPFSIELSDKSLFSDLEGEDLLSVETGKFEASIQKIGHYGYPSEAGAVKVKFDRKQQKLEGIMRVSYDNGFPESDWFKWLPRYIVN